MFKRNNQDPRHNTSKPPLKKRNFLPNNKMEEQNVHIKSPLERYVETVSESQFKCWQKYESTHNQILSKEDKHKRHKIFLWLFKQVKPVLNLKLRTIQHTIKMLDIYSCKRDEKTKSKSQTKSKNVYPCSEDLILNTMTCLHLSCKYNQIYPPDLIEIVNLVESKSSLENVLDNQIDILQILDLNLNVAVVSDWFKMINKQEMPSWAAFCYLQYELKTESRLIAEQISRFIQKMQDNSSIRQSFIEFSRMSQLAFNQMTLKLFEAFTEFKFRNQISKLSLIDDNKPKQSN